MEAVLAAGDDCVPGSSGEPNDLSPRKMLRIKEQMSNQCFEMAAHINAGKINRACSQFEAEREIPGLISEMERVKTNHFNSTLVLHRMQLWHAIAEKLKDNDAQARRIKELSERCMAMCSSIKLAQNECRDMQNGITEIQKERLELKRLTLEKLKEIEVMLKEERPETEKYRALLEKGKANLEKYKKMVNLTQNVLRGIILACKVNWLDDPELKDIVMTLEEFPISD